MNKNKIQHLGVVGDSIGSSLLCLEAKKRGIKTTLLESTLDSMTTRFADEHLIVEANDTNIEKLALRVDAIVFGKDIYTSFPNKLQDKIITYPSLGMMERLKTKIGWLRLAEENEIPIPKYYYQDNTQDFFEEIKELPFPFKFYQFYNSRYESQQVTTPDEMSRFLADLDENADSWLTLQQETYQSILTITGVLDATGKAYTYEVSETKQVEDREVIISPAKLSKTATTKLIRYTKKLLKGLGEAGVYSFKYGLKPNKGILLIDVTIALEEHQVATEHDYNLSVYEALMNLITGVKMVQPKMFLPSMTYQVTEEEKFLENKLGVYHLYQLQNNQQLVVEEQE